MLSDGKAKIADLGFCEDIDAPKCNIYYNVGSPNYMCPQSLNENKYSFKSDVWSIGALYYELLVGRTPWQAPTEKVILFYLNDNFSTKKFICF
jgi:serine/threonine protein kinase